MFVGMEDRFPPYTSRESRARPAALGRLFCALSVLSYGLAALIDLSIVASPAFVADFDGGTKTADVADDAGLATGLLIAGAVLALAAVIRGGGYAVRAAGVVLILGVGCGMAVLTLALSSYYVGV
jgi:hypothetical protein